jgi:hypothetical protein
MIEMIQDHHAGVMLPGDVYWDDLRWTLTDRGRRASDAQLERIMLRDPPLEIAESDAKDEANDVATDCGGCDIDDSDTRNAPAHIHQSRQACWAHPPENGAASEARGRRITETKHKAPPSPRSPIASRLLVMLETRRRPLKIGVAQDIQAAAPEPLAHYC